MMCYLNYITCYHNVLLSLLLIIMLCVGIAMFHKRAQEILSSVEGTTHTTGGNFKQLLLNGSVEVLNSSDKSTLAETLREIEMERQRASEER